MVAAVYSPGKPGLPFGAGLPWIDLHLHSSASHDCSVPAEKVDARCRLLGLGPVFLTDHDSVAGAETLGEQAIKGEEISTLDGELIGLFLQSRIEPGNPALETARAIRDQGGLVYLQHPYDRFRRHISEDCLQELAPLIDVVEVFNARSDEEANRRAADLCEILDAAPGAGSDSHFL